MNERKALWSAYCSSKQVDVITDILEEVTRIDTVGKTHLFNIPDGGVLITDTGHIAHEVFANNRGEFIKVNPDGKIIECSYDNAPLICTNPRCPLYQCPVENLSPIQQKAKKREEEKE